MDAVRAAAIAPRLPLSRRAAYACAVGSGLLYWAAFPGNTFEWWPLAFVAYVPLWIALQGQTPKTALGLGLATGTTMNVAGFYWLLGMLRTFSGFPTPACLFFLLCVCGYQGGRLAFSGWLYARGVQRGWPATLIFLLALAASELVFPVLFPWYFANTLHAVPIFSQSADLGGPILVGTFLSTINLAIGEPLLAHLEKRTYRRAIVIAGACSLAFMLAYGAFRMHDVDKLAASRPSARVGVVQGNMGLIAKRVDPSEGLRRHQGMTRELKNQGIDFTVWSESSVTFQVPEEMKDAFMHDRVASHLGVPAIFGAILFRADHDRERWYNTALATDVSGNVIGRYNKEFLLAFGEYLPFGETFPILYKWSPNSGKFTPGTTFDPLTVTVAGTKHTVTPLICYEDILASFTNAAVRNSHPELLVNMTNDAWFGATAEPWEHLGLAQYRAIEHRLFLVRSTNSGVSAFIDPVGREVKLGHLTDFDTDDPVKAEGMIGEIRWMPGGTLYEHIGDIPWWLVTIASITAAFLAKKPRKSDAAIAPPLPPAA